MPSHTLDYEVFDADNHMYETKEALTQFLPDRYKGVIDYVEVRGRTKIVVKGQIREYIPNPTFDVVARPGAQEEYFRNGNPEGKSYRELIGKPDHGPPAFRRPAPRLELMDELGLDRALMFPTLASLVEERLRDDIAGHPRRHPRAQRVDARDLDVQLRGPHLRHPGHHPARRRQGRRGAGVVPRARARRPSSSGPPRCPRSAARAPRPASSSSTRSGHAVQEAGIPVCMHASDSGYSRYAEDWEGGGTEFLPFKPNPFRFATMHYRAIIDTFTAPDPPRRAVRASPA